MKSEGESSNILIEPKKPLCRVCLTENIEKPTSLFEVNNDIMFSQRIMLCSKVQIHDNDGLPNIICNQCISDLNIADNFRIKCEYSDSVLRKIYLKEMLKQDSDSSLRIVSSTINEPCFEFKDEDVKLEPEYIPDSLFNDTTPIKSSKKNKKNKIKESDLADKNGFGISDSESSISFNEDLDENIRLTNESSFPIQDANITNQMNKKNILNSLCTKTEEAKAEFKNCDKIGKVIGSGANKRFHCTECKYSTPRSESLVYHIRTHTGERPYQCGQCDRRFSQRGSLIYHKKTHSDKMYFTCAECGKQFKHKDQFERHKNVHNKEKNYICSLCNKSLKSKITLEVHMNRHKNIKNYNCETCGATFVTSSELIMHSKGHTTKRKFQCNICPFGSNTKANLDNHLRRHSGERPFKCNCCEWAFFTCYELKAHSRKHTKERKYPCPDCQQKFKSSSGLNRHVLRLHGKKYKWSDNADRRIIK